MAEQEHLENPALAARLEAFAALLELAGASAYSARAYRRAAALIRSTPLPVADLVREGRVQELRGVGRGIEGRLTELVETGEIAELDELERAVSPELVGLGRFLGFGARQAVEIGRTLGVRTGDELRAAAREGRLSEVPGIGPKREAKLLAALEQPEPAAQGVGLLLHRASTLAEALAAGVGGTVAGEVRRRRDRCESVAVVCAAESPEAVLDRFASLPEIVSVLKRRLGRAVGVTLDGVPVECVVSPPETFGTALVRATGAPAYVDALGPLPAASTEEGVYRRLGIPFCPPELREAPFRGEPPALLDLGHLRGDLHCHTTWSDGKATVLEMGLAARERGYAYLAVCDHTPNVRVVPGLDADALRRQAEEIAGANEELAPFRLLRGAECDIRADGSLDLPDDVLAELEWVQLSLHAGQRAPRAELTRKVTEAMRHPAVRSLSHPTGRLIDHRPPNALDLERVLEVALETGVALEVNGLPDRLDLRDEHVRMAVDAGVALSVSTDAHSTAGLGNMALAVATARRGWATAADVVNTRPLEELLRRPPG